MQLGVYLKACSGVCLRAFSELTCEHTVKQAGSVPSSAIGRVLRAYLGTQSSRLGVCHRVQLRAF